MSRTHKDSLKSKTARRGRDRAIAVRGIRRDPPDMRKLSRALISLALAEAAAEQATLDGAEPMIDPADSADSLSDSASGEAL